VTIDDLNPYARRERKSALNRIAFMPQTAAVPRDLTALDFVAYLTWMRGKGRSEARSQAMQALDAVGLAGRAEDKLKKLSGGMVRRVWFAQALAAQAGTLLLDEPISALDIAHAVEVLSLVRRMCHLQGRSAIIVLHEINMAARFCDHIVALKGGRLALQGTPADLMRPAALEAIYGLPMEVLTRPDGQLVTVPA